MSDIRNSAQAGSFELKMLFDDKNVVNRASMANMPGVMLLDGYAITARMMELSESDPYFARRDVSSFVERVSLRVADRMASSLSRDWAAPPDMIAEAIYFFVWSELCTIIPLRRLARSIARTTKQSTIFVAFPRFELTCLQGWFFNELEPLFLCWALQRQGCNAYLLSKTRVPGSSPSSVSLRPGYIASRGPLSNGGTFPKGSTIVAADGIRGLAVTLEETENAVYLAGEMFFSVPPRGPTFFLLEPEFLGKTISLNFREHDASDFASLRQFSLALPQNLLLWYFDQLLRPYFVVMLKRMRAFLAGAESNQAHVCDHLFFASSILTHAVKERGGTVTLWPHSANPVSSEVRRGEYFDEVAAVTQAGREIWKRRFPDKVVKLRPRCMLPPQRAPRAFDTSAPLTVIVFGGAQFVARLPSLRIESHVQTYQRSYKFYRPVTAPDELHKGRLRET